MDSKLHGKQGVDVELGARSLLFFCPQIPKMEFLMRVPQYRNCG